MSEVAPASGAPTRNHTSTAIRGMSWIAGHTVVSRLVTFGSQLVVGFLLTPADFGLYALAVSLNAAVSGLRNGGTAQLMMAQGLRYRIQLAVTSQYALVMNTVAFVVLLLLGWAAGTAKGIGALGWLVMAIGLSAPLGTPVSIYRTELAILGRFRDLAVLNTISTVLWQAEVVGLAALGFGPYSLALPNVVQSVVDGLVGWHFLRHWPLRGPRLTGKQFLVLLRETRWIMVGLIMATLGLVGPYFVAGLFTAPTTVGLFFFGFQLAFTLFLLLSNSIENVLPPMLARLNDSPAQQSATTLEMLRILIVVSLPVAGAISLGAHAAVHLLWGGRWDQSAPVLAIVVWSVPGWIAFQVVRALLDARALWTTRLVILALYGVGSCTVVAIAAALTHDLEAMALALSGFYALFGLALLALLSALTAEPILKVFGPVAAPGAVCAACAGLALAACRALPAATSDLAREGAAVLVFSVLAAAANRAWFSGAWREAIGTLFGKRTALVTAQ